MTLEAEQLAFNARALAQAHPLTPLATQFVNRAVAQQRTSQPVPEIGIWAGAALINGYCLRRVEESQAGMALEARPDAELDLERLDEEASRIAGEVRSDTGTSYFLTDDERVVAALDRIIASEVNRRLEHWRDSVDDAAWAELEEYITWWVVKGYAVRVAEVAAGALA